MIVRIATGIKRHFPTRVSEWFLSGALVAWGWILLSPGDTFSASPSFAHMAVMASERTWGLAAITVGLVRVVALIINGTFADTGYSRASPYVRAIMSILACFVWAQITLGLIGAPNTSTGLAVYPILFLLDSWNCVRAAGDAGEARKARTDAAV